MASLDILVVGAGPSGLSAARQLVAAGRKCLVLEARSRAGGRAYTADQLGCDFPVDQGAAWLHGYEAEGHPLSSLIKADGIQVPGCGMSSKTEHELLWDGRIPASLDRKAASIALRRVSALVDARREMIEAGSAQDCSWADAVIQGCGAANLDQAIMLLLSSGAASIVEVDEVEESEGNPWSLDGSDDGSAEEDGNGDEDDSGPQKLAKLDSEGVPDMDAQRALVHMLIGLRYENWEGASLDRYSVMHAESCPALEGPNADISGGYGNFVAQFAKELDIKYGHVVTDITYPDALAGDGQVVVTCQTSDGIVAFQSPFCIVTLPLRVLPKVSFDPVLSDDKLHAIATLGTARMNKVQLCWDERWWPDSMHSLSLANRDSTALRIIWPWWHEPAGARAADKAILICYVTGKFAEDLELMDPDEVKNQCVTALREAFPAISVPAPSSFFMTRWLSDQFALASWTCVSAGSTPQDATHLAQPCGANECLAFAGEHTCDGSRAGLDMGTVHGAWLSGTIAADHVLLRLSKSCRANA